VCGYPVRKRDKTKALVPIDGHLPGVCQEVLFAGVWHRQKRAGLRFSSWCETSLTQPPGHHFKEVRVYHKLTQIHVTLPTQSYCTRGSEK